MIAAYFSCCRFRFLLAVDWVLLCRSTLQLEFQPLELTSWRFVNGHVTEKKLSENLRNNCEILQSYRLATIELARLLLPLLREY